MLEWSHIRIEMECWSPYYSLKSYISKLKYVNPLFQCWANVTVCGPALDQGWVIVMCLNGHWNMS